MFGAQQVLYPALVAMLLAVSVAAAMISTTTTTTRPGWMNVTIYRVTPRGYKGVTNMDTADVPGDILFGMSQLLLPVLCADDSSFLWCENRAYLSGGRAKMVYSEFVVSTKPLYGNYAACNPCTRHAHGQNDDTPVCPKGVENGTFMCTSFDKPPAKLAPQCAVGYELWHDDCVNGTVYKTLAHASDGECCAACTSDPQCEAWTKHGGFGSPVCQLMRHPITYFEIARTSDKKCQSAIRDPGASVCWYSDPTINKTFAPYCSHGECACKAVETLAMGREQNAMCHHHRHQLSSGGAGVGGWMPTSRWAQYIFDFSCKMLGTWYSTQEPGMCRGPDDKNCFWELIDTRRTVNATCVDNTVVETVVRHRPACFGACPQPHNNTSPCVLDCLFQTMLGNTTTGIEPMPVAALNAAFESAFKPGACPDAGVNLDKEAEKGEEEVVVSITAEDTLLATAYSKTREALRRWAADGGRHL